MSTRKLPVSIGKHPFDLDDMIANLKEFHDIYQHRPIKNNSGGQLAAQLFYSWYVAKTMQPKYIIESGTYKGQGTWAFEQACPDAKILCLDPFPKEIYKSPNAQYIKSDFTTVDWTEMPKDDCLAFFDDHQNALERIMQCKKDGFKYVMFEDNYPPGQGDCMSLKKALSQDEKHEILPGLSTYDYLKNIIDVYYEMPPIFDIQTNRWGLPWNTYGSNKPLLTNVSEQYHKVYYDDMSQYTWINYVELK
tara:strand:- start:76 stop:819 length:744 start_codon:yes stop_codon:yes gene_type:complete